MNIESIRILNGYLEINGERVAQLLPKIDERFVREEILGRPDMHEEARMEGYEDGREDQRDAMHAKFEDAITRLRRREVITREQEETILEEVL